jgi:hypothetical protein
MFYGKRLTAGLIAAVMAAALVLAGCDNGTTSGNSDSKNDTEFKGTWKNTDTETWEDQRGKRDAQGKYLDTEGTAYVSYYEMSQAGKTPAYVDGKTTYVTTTTYTFEASTWEWVNTSVETFTPTNPADANPVYYTTTYTRKSKGTYAKDSDGIATLTLTHRWSDGDTEWWEESDPYTMSAAIIGKKLYIVGEEAFSK